MLKDLIRLNFRPSFAVYVIHQIFAISLVDPLRIPKLLMSLVITFHSLVKLIGDNSISG